MAGNDPLVAIDPNRRGELSLDADLLSLGQDGSVTLDQKISELFDSSREAVYRYVMTIVGSPAVAEEVTQEAFINLYNYLRSGQSVGHYRAWIFRAAHNLALNEVNRKVLVS